MTRTELTMAYTRKTRDEYEIQQNWGYGHGWETVTTEETWKDARDQAKTYRQEQPGIPCRIKTRRVKIQPEAR
jgi:hypothetical protein